MFCWRSIQNGANLKKVFSLYTPVVTNFFKASTVMHVYIINRQKCTKRCEIHSLHSLFNYLNVKVKVSLRAFTKANKIISISRNKSNLRA